MKSMIFFILIFSIPVFSQQKLNYEQSSPLLPLELQRHHQACPRSQCREAGSDAWAHARVCSERFLDEEMPHTVEFSHGGFPQVYYQVDNLYPTCPLLSVFGGKRRCRNPTPDLTNQFCATSIIKPNRGYSTRHSVKTGRQSLEAKGGEKERQVQPSSHPNRMRQPSLSLMK